MCSNEEEDRLLLCQALPTKIKVESREGKKKKSNWGAKVRKRAEKRHLETEGEPRKRFGLTGVINNGPKCSFTALDLAGSSC